MKFKTGDKVKILIGQPMWRLEKFIDGVLVQLDEVEFYDLSPELVGKEAIILYGSITQGKESYALDVDGHGFVAWFALSQIKKLKKRFLFN